MTSINKQSINRVFVKFVFIAITVPLLTLGTAELIISSIILKKELKDSNGRYIEMLSERVENSVFNPLRAANTLSSLLLVKSEGVELFANNILNNYQQILEIKLVDNNGIITNSYSLDESAIGIDISGYDYYKIAKDSHNVYWSSSFLSYTWRIPVLALVVPNDNGMVVFILSLKELTSFLDSNIIDKNKLNITITDQKGVYITSNNKSKVLLRENNPSYNMNRELWKGDILVQNREIDGVKCISYIKFIPELNWMITLNKPVKYIYGSLKIMILALVSILGLVLFIGIFLARRMSFAIIDPLNILLSSTKVIANGNYSRPIPGFKVQEFSQLAESFNIMMSSIQSSKNNLESEVKKRTSELEKSHKHLILTERMAALGGLVAGVAHEINTPIGITVTSASFLGESAERFLDMYNKKELTKSAFLKFCNDTTESTRLILSSSRRASELIRSFKEVAVDQTRGDQREFEICKYTKEVVSSLHHEFKRTNINISVEHKEEIQINSFPGSYAQIITNLLHNSLIHGFETEKSGEIVIDLKKNNGMIFINYRDSGKGILPEHLEKIFDPFFTTKRDQGGSGLGLNIVYNIVTQKLFGDIQCISELGNGTEFHISFPIDKI